MGGKPIQDNFHLENRPRIQNSQSLSSIHHISSPIEVTYSSIGFDVAWQPDNLITKQILVTTKKLINGSSTGENLFYPLNRQGPERITLTSLEPNTVYQIEYSLASGEPHNLKTSKSNNIIVATNPFSTPTNVRISDITESSFVVSYKRPHTIAPNVEIDNYEIDVYDASGQNTMPTVIQPSNNDSQGVYRATIDNLDFSTEYQVKISAKSKFQPKDDPHIVRKQYYAETKAITIPARLESPNIISVSHHNMSIRWNSPLRIAPASSISNYVVLYERIDPHSLNSLVNAKTQFSRENEITLQDLAAGATYKVQVKVRTTSGESQYSSGTIANTPMVQSELEEFRESLNLPAMELKIDSMQTQTRTLQTLANGIDLRTTAIENKPRFAAEIRPSPSSGYSLPKGDITDFTELVDVGGIFNPTTGRLTTNGEGDFLLHVSAYKSGNYGNRGEIMVFKNEYVVQEIRENDEENSSMMNAVFTLHLQKGDEVKLNNRVDESIHVHSYNPLTFTGYKI